MALFRRLFLLACAAGALVSPVLAQFRIKDHGVHSAAATREADGLAPGSAFVVHGGEFFPEGTDTVRAQQPYPLELAGIRVYFVAPDNETVFRAPIVEATPVRIDAIVPLNLQPGRYLVSVMRNGQATELVPVNIVERSLGVVTWTRGEGGPAAAWMVRGAEYVMNRWTAPARPGERIEVLAAGLGSTNLPANELPSSAPAIPGDETPAAEVILDGRAIPVLSLGKDLSRPGYDRIVFDLPAEDLPTGCAVGFTIRTGNLETDTATLTIAPEGEDACRHPLGFDTETLKRIDAGEAIVLGDFRLLRSKVEGLEDPDLFLFGGQFTRQDFLSLAANIGLATDNLLAPRGCVELPDRSEFFTVGDGAVATGPATLELVQPGGAALPIERNEYGYYSALAPAPFSAGDYLLRAAGGGFETPLRVSNPVEWTNPHEVEELHRDRELKITWTPGSSNEMVLVNAASRGPAPWKGGRHAERGVQCFAPASDGELTVPANLMSRLPATVDGDEGAYGALSVVHTSRRVKAIPLNFGFANVHTRFLSVR